MAKNSFGKVLAGVTIIGAGVALGLAIFNKLDTIKRELESDEFEDEFDYEEEDAELPETDYVTINPAAADDQPASDTDTSEDSEDTEDSKPDAE